MKELIVYQSVDGVIFTTQESCLAYENSIKELQDIVKKYIGLNFPDGNTEYKQHDIKLLYDFAKDLRAYILSEAEKYKDDRYFTRTTNILDTDVIDGAKLSSCFYTLTKFIELLSEKYYKDCLNVNYKFYYYRLKHRLNNYFDFYNGVEYGATGFKDMYRNDLDAYLAWREEELEANKTGHTTLR